METPETLKAFTVKLNPELTRTLEQEMARLGVPAAEILRRALVHYVHSHQGETPTEERYQAIINGLATNRKAILITTALVRRLAEELLHLSQEDADTLIAEAVADAEAASMGE